MGLLGMTQRKLLLWLPVLFLLPVAAFAQQQEDPFTSLLHRGFALHQQADYTHALPLLQQAWKLDPHDYFVNLLLGIDLLRTGNPQKAIGFLATAERLRPKEDIPYAYAGEAQTQLGYFDEAATSFMKGVDVAQDKADATEAWIEYTLERFHQLAEQLRSSQPGLAAEYRLQARSYAADDMKRRALLQQSAELDAQAPGIWSEWALADFKAGDAAAAQEHVNRALTADPLDPQATLVASMLAGNPPTEAKAPAVAHTEPQRNDSAASLNAWLKRGIALAQVGQCHQAIPALERSLERGPELGLAAREQTVYTRFLLSWCYADEAGKVDAQIRQSGGNLAMAHLIRGDVLFRMQGNTAGAIAEYQAALAMRHGDPKLLERLAEAQVASGDFTNATQNAEAALQLDPHRYGARQTLARIAMEQGRYDDALPQLKTLAEQDPHDAGTQISLATALSQAGNPAEALQHLEPVLAGGYPDQKGNLHSLLGALLRKAGRPTEAAQAFATARQLSETYQQSSHRDQE